VSKPLPDVSIESDPVAGATHRYQMLAPPALPAWFGSPVSFVADTLVPDVVPLEAESVRAALKASFAGAASVTDGDVTWSVTVFCADQAPFAHRALKPIVWVPADSAVVENDALDEIVPSRLDIHSYELMACPSESVA
jgi:hypothetical protein